MRKIVNKVDFVLTYRTEDMQMDRNKRINFLCPTGMIPINYNIEKRNK